MRPHKLRKLRKLSQKGFPAAAMMMGSRRDWGGAFGPDFPFGPDGPFGPGGPFGNGSGRKRRGRMFGSGELRLVLLHLIAEEPRHGYELIKAIEDLTGGGYAPSPGTIYPTLSLLEDEGCIAQTTGEEARKAYEATKQGRDELAEREEEASAIMDRLAAHGAKRKTSKMSPDLFRALGNLTAVFKNRVRAGGMDEDAMREIVDMIDEMAKKIERM